MSKSFQEKQQDTQKKISRAKLIDQGAFILAVILCIVLVSTSWLHLFPLNKEVQEILGFITLGFLFAHFVSRFATFHLEGKLVSK